MSLGAWLSSAGFQGIYRDFECMYAGESNAWQTFSGVVAGSMGYYGILHLLRCIAKFGALGTDHMLSGGL